MLTDPQLTDEMVRDLLRSLPDADRRTAEERDVAAACRWIIGVHIPHSNKVDARRRIVDYINASAAKQAAEPELTSAVLDSSPDAILSSIVDQMQRLSAIGVASHGIGLIVEAVKALAVVQQQTRLDAVELSREVMELRQKVRDLRRDVRDVRA